MKSYTHIVIPLKIGAFNVETIIGVVQIVRSIKKLDLGSRLEGGGDKKYVDIMYIFFFHDAFFRSNVQKSKAVGATSKCY